MISKGRIQYIKSLQVKKYRKQEQCFVVEGAKGVRELIRSDFDVKLVCATRAFIESTPALKALRTELIEVGEKTLAGLGSFQTNDSAVAVAGMKANEPYEVSPGEIALALDDIRDPGNLGTIIRTADWYGITKIIASEETADFYNPKVISATMGSFTRTRFFYTSLPDLLRSAKCDVFGAFLQGEDVHATDFQKGGLVVIGNESNGISHEVGKYVSRKITIPRIGSAESLNAAVAAAVILDNAMRQRTASKK